LDDVIFSLFFQSSPTASVASDIVYRHVPSATCVSEVSTLTCIGHFLSCPI